MQNLPCVTAHKDVAARHSNLFDQSISTASRVARLERLRRRVVKEINAVAFSRNATSRVTMWQIPRIHSQRSKETGMCATKREQKSIKKEASASLRNSRVSLVPFAGAPKPENACRLSEIIQIQHRRLSPVSARHGISYRSPTVSIGVKRKAP